MEDQTLSFYCLSDIYSTVSFKRERKIQRTRQHFLHIELGSMDTGMTRTRTSTQQFLKE